jgi:hypothetical protein
MKRRLNETLEVIRDLEEEERREEDEEQQKRRNS